MKRKKQKTEETGVNKLAEGSDIVLTAMRLAVLSWVVTTANRVEDVVLSKKVPSTKELSRVISEEINKNDDLCALVSGNPLLVAAAILGAGEAAPGIPDKEQAIRYQEPFLAKLAESKSFVDAVWTVIQLAVLDVLLERGLDLPELRERKKKA